MNLTQSLNPITTFIPPHFNMSKKDKEKEREEGRETDKRPQRDEHEKDEAVEEYVTPNPNDKPENLPNDPEEEGMGRSEKAKKQPSDERDRYMDDDDK